MSLKYDYFDGVSGILAQVDAAFAAGQAFVGVGAVDVESIFLGDRNGSNLAAGSGNPGFYFDINGPSGGYRVWIQVSGEVAPASAGRSLVQMNLLSGDTASQVAVKIAAALTAITSLDFNAISIGGSVESTTTTPKAVGILVLGPSGWGTAVAAVVSAGVNPTGNYLAIRNDLRINAASGFTCFTLNYPATMSSALLRGANGGNAASKCPRHPNAQHCNCGGTVVGNGSKHTQPNNLILKAYLAGITDALATQNIYSYEVTPSLNISDNIDTSIDLNFNF